MSRSTDHEEFMKAALEQADAAARLGEVPVGAVVVREGKIIAHAHNRRELAQDPMAHAEVLALSRAAKILDSWRLEGCTLYVTLEPCPMCAGALVNARVDHLVYGCPDPKAGAVRTLYTVCDDPRLNHRLKITRGIRAAECSLMLSRFFAELRAKAAKEKEAKDEASSRAATEEDPDHTPTVIAEGEKAPDAGKKKLPPQVTVAFEAREDDKPTVIADKKEDDGLMWEPKKEKPPVTVAFEVTDDDRPTVIADGEVVPQVAPEEEEAEEARSEGRIPMAPRRKPSMAPRLIPKPRSDQETVPPGATIAFVSDDQPPLDELPTNPVGIKGGQWPPAPGRTMGMGLGDLPLPDLAEDGGRPAEPSEIRQEMASPGRTLGLDELTAHSPAEERAAEESAARSPTAPPKKHPTAPPKKRPKAPSMAPKKDPDKSASWGVDPTPTRDYSAQSDDAEASRRTGKKK